MLDGDAPGQATSKMSYIFASPSNPDGFAAGNRTYRSPRKFAGKLESLPADAPECDASVRPFAPKKSAVSRPNPAVLRPKSDTAQARKFGGKSKTVEIDDNPSVLHL
jgi:hypothetical protein